MMALVHRHMPMLKGKTPHHPWRSVGCNPGPGAGARWASRLRALHSRYPLAAAQTPVDGQLSGRTLGRGVVDGERLAHLRGHHRRLALHARQLTLTAPLTSCELGVRSKQLITDQCPAAGTSRHRLIDSPELARHILKSPRWNALSMQLTTQSTASRIGWANKSTRPKTRTSREKYYLVYLERNQARMSTAS